MAAFAYWARCSGARCVYFFTISSFFQPPQLLQHEQGRAG
jgi:hypothetical protein